ncbi:MAG: hypothetical protein J6K04_13485 [Lachnospiraceae bacterium]|nr:hypothetical protein [Lachnospiraceae bacterium]MBP3570163.1 hypothetical protein [Lachnospiraceae bacterium]
MKSKAPLVMMEQIVMVLIFALAAALCLQTFVLSGKISKNTEELNRASIEAQNAAETLKAVGLGSYLLDKNAVSVKGGYQIALDEAWNHSSDPGKAAYYLLICPENHDSDFFWKAELVVARKDGTELFRIPVAGQTEVTEYE